MINKGKHKGWDAAVEMSTHLVVEDDASNALGVPEKLVDIVISDNLVVIPFSSNEFSVLDLVALVPNEAIERFDDVMKVQSFGSSFGPILAFGRSIIVVGALENEAHAFCHKPNISCFTPA